MAGEAKNFSYTRTSALDSMVETMQGCWGWEGNFLNYVVCVFFPPVEEHYGKENHGEGENQWENVRCWPYSSQMGTSHICLSINFQSIPHITRSLLAVHGIIQKSPSLDSKLIQFDVMEELWNWQVVVPHEDLLSL